MKKFVSGLFLLLFLCGNMFAQKVSEVKTLTIDEAVNYAIQNSRTLKSASIDLEIKKRAKDNCWNVIIPSLTGSATISRVNEYKNMMGSIMSAINSIPEPQPTEANYWTFVGNVNAQLNLNLALIQGVKATKANYEAGLITWEQNLKETELNVRKMFYGILMQQESISLQEINFDSAKERYEQSKKNFAGGLVPELMLLQAQVSYENQKPALEKSKQAFLQQLDMFAFLLGMPFGTKLQLVGEIKPEFKILDAKNLVSQYLNNRLDVQSMRKNLELTRISLAANNLSTYTPSLSLNYGWQPIISSIDSTDKNTSGSWKNPTDNGSFSATLVWNITNMLPFTSNGQKIKDSKQNIQKLEIALQTVLQNAEMQIHHLVDKLEQSKDAIATSQRNANLAQKAYEQTYEAYKAGTQELLDVKDAENQMNMAKLGLMSEKMNYVTNLLDLEYAVNSKL